MTFPFYKQETVWTCGPAVMRMSLEKLGIKKSEKQLIKILKTNKIKGTSNKDFSRVAEQYKLNYIVKRNSTIEDLKYFSKKRYILIFCYYYPKEKIGHYSILKKIDYKFIYFYDPYFGKNHKYNLKYFNKIWKCNPKHDNEKHWFFGVKNAISIKKRSKKTS